jgi:hypothetical protein
MGDIEHERLDHMQFEDHHERAASTDVADLGLLSDSLASKKHGFGHAHAHHPDHAQPDLVRQIESISAEGGSTVVVIRKHPGDAVIPAGNPGERPGYVQGLLGGEFWIRSVTETQVVGVINDLDAEKIQGSWSAVLNASQVPRAGAPVALKGEKTLEKDTPARITNYSIVGGKQFMLSIAIGTDAGVQPGMVGQLKFQDDSSFYSFGHFTIERVGPVFALALLEFAEAAGSLDYVKQVIMGCVAVVFAPVQAAPAHGHGRGHH